MSIWRQLAERMRGRVGGANRTSPGGEVDMTYADRERDETRKEVQRPSEGVMAGAGQGEFLASRTGTDEPVRGSEDET